MRLAPRLVLAFSALAVVSTAGLGYVVRRDRHLVETQRFDAEVRRACTSVSEELDRQGARDHTLIAGACKSGELVDRVSIAEERGDLESSRIRFAQLVPQERVAFDLDELALVADGGDIIGADPKTMLAAPRADIEKMLASDASSFSIRTTGKVSLVSACTRSGTTRTVGLVGARAIAPMLDRLGKTLDVRVNSTVRDPDSARALCTFADASGHSIPIVVTKSKAELYENLSRVDQAVLVAVLGSLGIALLFGVVLARSLGQPLAILAEEASKVAADEARPLRVRGSGEVRDLTIAFDKMIEDLAVTRRRLAATSRVAAWREVARRVAHEVKNPLAPIRAAVETLRRLHAREDPEFEKYFDEATRTVLDEVHRISNIVTEFTRFARLPPPRPQEIDLEEVVKHVLTVNKAAAGATHLETSVRHAPPKVRADRDQIVQVLTNLVQNAMDAVKGQDDPRVSVVLDADRAGNAHVAVCDNGPGIAQEIAARLFEPYATTKESGTGLGLAIAQRIAIEHNGELSYLGTNGSRGAVFRLVLPIEGPPPMSDAPTPPPV